MNVVPISSKLAYNSASGRRVCRGSLYGSICWRKGNYDENHRKDERAYEPNSHSHVRSP